MYTKEQLKRHIEELNIDPHGTLKIHSSMKAVGEVEGGAETVLDAFIEYMQQGLLIFPAHTWATINEQHLIYNPLTEPSCVGILSNLFLKRNGVIRSLHPTHSVAVIGKGAEEFVAGEEKADTPCPRGGCYNKLIDKKAKILFLGCPLSKNTFIHGVEEWNNIPNRLTQKHTPYRIAMPDGSIKDCPSKNHKSPVPDISVNYIKLEKPFLKTGIAVKGRIGDAVSVLCDVSAMAELTGKFLKNNPDLFLDDKPVPEEWYS